MAVIHSGNEIIIRYSRWLVGVYYVLVVACGLLALVLGVAALGQAVGDGKWTDKFWGVFGFGAGSISFAGTAVQMYTMGRSYGRTFVAIGPEALRFQLPRSDGDLLMMSGERRIPWTEIKELTYTGNWKERTCQFVAGENRYTLYKNNCPSPRKVAELIAEHIGQPLTDLSAEKSKATHA